MSTTARERDALKQVADIAIEVLISSRNLTVRGVAGDATYSVPDIQATAIRLSDSAIIGQASASDVLGAGPPAGQIARRFGANDITEATAFALMEDMVTVRGTTSFRCLRRRYDGPAHRPALHGKSCPRPILSGMPTTMKRERAFDCLRWSP